MFNKIYAKVKDYIVHNYKFLISVIIVVLICTINLPYVVYTPGGVVNLNERISGGNGYTVDGSLNMSYVSMLRGKIPVLALSFIIKDWDILKASDITADERNIDEQMELEKLYMQSSIDNATIVAYHASGQNIDINKQNNNVVYIADEAKTDIQIYDKVLEVEGHKVNDINDLKTYINTKKEGDNIAILVLRDNKEVLTTSKIYNTEDGLKVGIMFLPTYEFTLDPEIEVKTKSSESGSSGGLMLSLAIYNSLVKEDITHGLKVVGTGTIDASGNVGEIDGVKYKILGAEKNKADIFLCPLENLKEALQVKEERGLKLKVKGVATFDEALEFLNAIG